MEITGGPGCFKQSRICCSFLFTTCFFLFFLMCWVVVLINFCLLTFEVFVCFPKGFLMFDMFVFCC